MRLIYNKDEVYTILAHTTTLNLGLDRQDTGHVNIYTGCGYIN
jgi:hypothetical protein